MLIKYYYVCDVCGEETIKGIVEKQGIDDKYDLAGLVSANIVEMYDESLEHLCEKCSQDQAKAIEEIEISNVLRCHACGCRVIPHKVMAMDNPFDTTESIISCPNCSSINTLIIKCAAECCDNSAVRPLRIEGELVWYCQKHYLKGLEVNSLERINDV